MSAKFNATVGQLRKLLERYPDDMPVVVDGYDAGYDNIEPEVVDLVAGAGAGGICGTHDEVFYDRDDPDEAVPTLCLGRTGSQVNILRQKNVREL